MYQKVEISHRTIVFSFLFLVFLWFLFYIRDLLLQLFIALLLTAILDPLVTKISSFKIPRGIAVLICYIVVLGTLSGLVATIAPPLVAQTTNFANSLPSYISQLGITPVISAELGNEFLTRVGSIPGQIVKLVLSIFSNIISVLTVFVFAFYLLLVRDRLDDQLSNFFGKESTKRLTNLVARVENGIGNWVRGQLILMVLVGILNYIGLTLLGIPFALPLAILSGLFEIVPYLGPIIAAIPGVVIGFGISNFSGFGVIVMALLVQQLENYVFVPKIMGKTIGISPIVVLLSLAVGERLAGVTGMLISIPTAVTLQVLLKNYLTKE